MRKDLLVKNEPFQMKHQLSINKVVKLFKEMGSISEEYNNIHNFGPSE